MVSVRDVARTAGTSVGTVSRVLNGAPNVSEDLRIRVNQAIEELRYRPNALAQSLRRQRSHTFGLVVPDITNPFFAELAKAIESEAARAGYSVILGNAMNSAATERLYLETLIARRVDGIILSSAVETTALALLAGIPFVLVDRAVSDVAQAEANVVISDNYGGAVAAVTYLLQLGHRRIALVGGPPHLSISRERQRGYQAAFAALGGEPPEDLIWNGPFDYFVGYQAAQHFLTQREQPSAIFACSDQQAIGVLRAIIDAGLRVPGDISVIGFDDVLLAQLAVPRLTTVAQPVAALGAKAVEIVVTQCREPGAQPQRATLPVSLVVRETTGPLAAVDGRHARQERVLT